jgi:D-alanyl-lipoteichoic acid acyltransferase DltB (MBOAT superfamily)
MRTNSERIDMILLSITILLSTGLFAATIGLDELFSGTLHLTVYDTYFIAPKFKLLVLTNAIVLYTSFLIRQSLCGFSRKLGNYVLLVSASILLLLSSFLENLIWVTQLMMNVGWHTTLSKDGSLILNNLTTEIVFIVIKLLLIATMFLTGYKLVRKQVPNI